MMWMMDMMIVMMVRKMMFGFQISSCPSSVIYLYIMVSVSLSFNTPCVGAYCWRVDIDRVSSLLALLDELLSFFMLRVLSESDMPSMSNRSSTFFKVGVLWKSGLLDEHDSLLDDRVMVP
jgi:hypothetical protein